MFVIFNNLLFKEDSEKYGKIEMEGKVILTGTTFIYLYDHTTCKMNKIYFISEEFKVEQHSKNVI